MPSVYFLLFFEFLKVGLFTFGGGYASLPFLYHMLDYSWFTLEQLTQMIAIAGVTPGPIGLNMATFTGFKTLGVFGAVISSSALVLPMIIVTTLVFKLYKKFSVSKVVKEILYVLRPASCALIASVGLKMFYSSILKGGFLFKQIDYLGLIIVLFLFILTFKLRRDPIIYMVIAAVIGVIVKFC